MQTLYVGTHKNSGAEFYNDILTYERFSKSKRKCVRKLNGRQRPLGEGGEAQSELADGWQP